MSVWLNYEATRMTLMRELGVMALDYDGSWIDLPLDQLDYAPGEMVPTPPPVPMEWLQDAIMIPRGEEPSEPNAPVPPLPPAMTVSYERER